MRKDSEGNGILEALNILSGVFGVALSLIGYFLLDNLLRDIFIYLGLTFVFYSFLYTVGFALLIKLQDFTNQIKENQNKKHFKVNLFIVGKELRLYNINGEKMFYLVDISNHSIRLILSFIVSTICFISINAFVLPIILVLIYVIYPFVKYYNKGYFQRTK